MTSGVIYHDFRGGNSVPAVQAPAAAVLLTASVLARGRRWVAVNEALRIACIALCGVCVAVSFFIFGALFGGI